MGLLDSVLGSVLGGSSPAAPQSGGAGALIQIVASMLTQQGSGTAAGGLAGLVEQFQRGGLGDVVNSWISTGQNLPISPGQLGQVLGNDTLSQLAQHTGMNTGDILGQLSQVLPQMVDHMTPEGRIPQGGMPDLGALLSRFAAPR
jgi:uncharacterized protein YidB (DUF937 family)